MDVMILTFDLGRSSWGLQYCSIPSTRAKELDVLLTDGWKIVGQSQDENRIFYTLVK